MISIVLDNFNEISINVADETDEEEEENGGKGDLHAIQGGNSTAFSFFGTFLVPINTGLEGFLGPKVLSAVFCNFHSLPFLPPLPSGWSPNFKTKYVWNL